MQDRKPDIPVAEDAPTRPINLLYGVFFIGILLSFALYVCVTMLLGANTSISEEYWNGEKYRMPLASYNDAYYKNDTLRQQIIRLDYGLFGKVDDPNVLVGRENFLFEVVREDNNFNYLRDYLGEYSYDEESLESIYQFLKIRQTAYTNQGAEYMLVVIPCAQTVYHEYMPGYIRNAAGTTRLQQLSEYLKTKNDITFIDLTSALLAAKDYGTLYNNTEDSLNSLGQYFVYQALYQALPDRVRAGTEMLDFDDVTLYTHYTDGKTLARTAGMSSVVKNETISLSNVMEFNYFIQELFPGVDVTYAGHSEGIEAAGETVLLEFSNEWDKIQLMPYFSTTFDDVVYKTDHTFKLPVIESTQPTLVIQFVHEYELSTLINAEVSESYDDGLNAGENPFTTAAPEITGQVWLDEDTVCLTGLVETGAVLTVSGDAAALRTVHPDGNRFFVPVELGEEKEIVVRLQATVADKSRSSAVKVTIVRGTEDIVPAQGVTVGSESRLFSTDIKQLVLPDTGTLSVLEAELNAFVSRIRSFNTWRETEFLQVTIPRSSTVYADYAPESLQPALARNDEYRALMSDLYTRCGWTVLDLTDDLRANRDVGKLYALTHEQWTDHGAYIGYRSLMNYISTRFPSVEPFALTDYTPVTQTVTGGELAVRLGFEADQITENTVHLMPLNDRVSYEQSGTDNFDLKGAFATMVLDSTLPVAIVLRDEAGTEMLESMASHFRVMIVMPEGETEIDDQTLMLFDPDYVIRLSSENTPGLYDWDKTE